MKKGEGGGGGGGGRRGRTTRLLKVMAFVFSELFFPNLNSQHFVLRHYLFKKRAFCMCVWVFKL